MKFNNLLYDKFIHDHRLTRISYYRADWNNANLDYIYYKDNRYVIAKIAHVESIQTAEYSVFYNIEHLILYLRLYVDHAFPIEDIDFYARGYTYGPPEYSKITFIETYINFGYYPSVTLFLDTNQFKVNKYIKFISSQIGD